MKSMSRGPAARPRPRAETASFLCGKPERGGRGRPESRSFGLCMCLWPQCGLHRVGASVTLNILQSSLGVRSIGEPTSEQQVSDGGASKRCGCADSKRSVKEPNKRVGVVGRERRVRLITI